MRAGLMRHRVRLIERVPEDTATGEALAESEKVYERYAAVRGLNAVVAADAVALELDVDYRFEFRADRVTLRLNTNWQLEWRGQRLEIVKAFDPDGRGRQFVVQAKLLGA